MTDDTDEPIEFPDTTATPTGPKRVMGGKPVLPRVIGRPVPPPGEAGTGDGGADGFTDTWEEVPDLPGDDSSAGWETVDDGQPMLVEGVKYVPGLSEVPKDSVNFEHVCCRAVRPNPDDPDPDGAVIATRAEPYLTFQGPVKPTARFGVFLVVVSLAFVAAFVLSLFGLDIGILIAVGVGLAVLLYMAASLLIVRSAMRGIQLAATRHVMEPKLERGKLFHATLDTAGSRIPGSVHARISDQQAPGLRPVEQPLLEGAGKISYMVRPQGRGLLTFAGLDVAITSSDGMWISDQKWALRTTVEVAPSLPAITWKALVTGYAPFDQSTPSSVVKLYRDIETEVVRDLAAGDKLRDVNWKLFSRLGKMIVRQRTTEGETTILFIIDGTQTMMLDQAGYRNLDMAVEVAQEMAEAGLRRNHEVGLLAFNEQCILDHVRPTRAKIQIKRIIKHLQNLANHHVPGEGEDPVEVIILGDPENLRLGLGQGLKQRNTANMTVIFFTDLQQTPEEIVQGISKAAQSGTRVAIMLMPSPKLKPVVGGKSDDLELRGIAHTNRMRELLIANGCEFMELNPNSDDFALRAETPPEPKAKAAQVKTPGAKPT